MAAPLAKDTSDDTSSSETASSEISMEQYRAYDTDIYVATVSLASPDSLRTAFAENSYGHNVTAKTSAIASANDAILAINGDYYGAQRSGYVIRNGVLYRSASSGSEDLVIYRDGSFGVVSESEVTAEALLEAGADAEIFVVRNLTAADVAGSVERFAEKVKAENIRRTAMIVVGRCLETDEIRYRTRVEPSNGKVREIAIESVKQQVMDYTAYVCLKPLIDAKMG